MMQRAETRLDGEALVVQIPMRFQRRGGRKRIVAPDGAALSPQKPSRDETLVAALVRAHRCRRQIESGQTRWITDPSEQAPAHLLAAGHHQGVPGRAAAERVEAG